MRQKTQVWPQLGARSCSVQLAFNMVKSHTSSKFLAKSRDFFSSSSPSSPFSPSLWIDLKLPKMLCTSLSSHLPPQCQRYHWPSSRRLAGLIMEHKSHLLGSEHIPLAYFTKQHSRNSLVVTLHQCDWDREQMQRNCQNVHIQTCITERLQTTRRPVLPATFRVLLDILRLLVYLVSAMKQVSNALGSFRPVCLCRVDWTAPQRSSRVQQVS